MTKIRIGFDPSQPLQRKMAEGVIEYARTHTDWRLIVGEAHADADGAIEPASPNLIGAIVARGRKRIEVLADYSAIAHFAVQHLIERGYRRFAGVDLAPKYAVEIRAALPKDFELVTAAKENSEQTAFICGSDDSAARLPASDHAILGLGDDALTCELAVTPISSIDPNAHLIGFRAAQQLDRLLSGRAAARQIVIPPLGITTRASTQRLAIADPDIARAVAFIRCNAHRPLAIADVLRDVPLHRRSLERGFRRAIGRSPAEALRHARVAIAQTLLSRTDQPMAEIARRAGFILPQHLTTAFKQVTGETPSRYRDQFKRK